MRRQRHHRQGDGHLAPDVLEQRKAVALRKLDVHQHQVGAAVEDVPDEPLAAPEADHVVAVEREQRPEELHVVGAVFDDQDRGHSTSLGAPLRIRRLGDRIRASKIANPVPCLYLRPPSPVVKRDVA